MFNYDRLPEYSEPLYRPPSEAYSLILQLTFGCSHNKCSFCTMYKRKKYYIKSFEEIKRDIDLFRENLSYVRRIFIADGDAMSVPTDHLIRTVKYIREVFPECERISVYASPKSIIEKSDEELKAIRDSGISLVYLGIESGDSETLRKIHKDVDSNGMAEVGKRIKKAGFKLSATLIVGINGQEDWRNHAINSGKIVSEIKPDFLGVLTLIISPGCEIYNLMKEGKFKEASSVDILKEIRTIIENINCDKEIVFRANHASNYLNLAGTLPCDKEKILKEIDLVLNGDREIKKKYRRL